MPTRSHDDEVLVATVGVLIKTLRALDRPAIPTPRTGSPHKRGSL